MREFTDCVFCERLGNPDLDPPRCKGCDQAFDAGRERSQVEWKPIETAPKDGTHVLVMTKDRIVQIAYCGDGEFWWRAFEHGQIYPQPTHWMPLPDPPKLKVPRETKKGGRNESRST